MMVALRVLPGIQLAWMAYGCSVRAAAPDGNTYCVWMRDADGTIEVGRTRTWGVGSVESFAAIRFTTVVEAKRFCEWLWWAKKKGTRR